MRFAVHAAVCSLLLFAGCSALTGRPTASVSHELAEDDADMAEALAQFARGLLIEDDSGDSPEALQAFERAAALDPDQHALYAKVAVVALRRNLPEAALVALETSAEQNPDEIQPWIDLAAAYELLGRLDDAVDCYLRAAELDPANAYVYQQHARIRFHQKRDRDALEALDDGIEATNDSAALRAMCYKAGRGFLKRKEIDRAVGCFELLARHADKDEAQFRALLGELYLELDRPREGVRNLKQSIARDPATPEAYVTLSLHYLEDDPDAAIDVLASARTHMPTNVAVLSSLGHMYSLENRFDEAIEAFDSIVAITGPATNKRLNASFYLHYGAVYEQSGRHAEAVEIFEASLDVYPDNHSVLNYLAYMWAEADTDLDKALAYVGRAIALEPESGAYLDTLGWVQYQRRDYPAALVHIERAAALMPEDPVILDHLGDVHAALGNRAEARLFWKKSLSADPDNDATAKKLRGD